jgi:hypothetical protein
MNSSTAIQGMEPLASQYKERMDNPEKLTKTFQAGQVNIIVAGAGQTTWFVTDFGVGRGNSVDVWR